MANAANKRFFLLVQATLLACFFCLAHPLAAHGASKASKINFLTEDSGKQAWTLNADKMTASAGGDILEAHGRVEMRQGKDYMKADFARFYTSSRWVFLQGNVEILSGGDTITASEAEFDIEGRTGWMRNGQIFVAGPHAYMTGDKITKHWGDRYSFKNAKLTACDGEVPAWSVQADDAVLEIDGYAQLWGTRFQVKDVPVVYSPYLVVPVKKDRQTGFLFPEFGSSSFKGTFYDQPFFWAIDQSRDLTINEQFMSKRGFMHGLTYRSCTAEDDDLWLRFDWLYDNKNITSDGGKNDEYRDGLVRTNKERYWLRGMYETRLMEDSLWQFRADVDLASDQYFLRDFESQFTKDRETLYNNFSRDLENVTADRVSQAMLFREWDIASVYLSGRYTQNPSFGNGNTSRSQDYTAQMIPSLDAFLHRTRPVNNIPLEFEASGQYAYFYRQEGTAGSRVKLTPKATLPLSSDYGSLVMSAALDSTFYMTDTKNFSSRSLERTGVREDGTHRFLPSYAIEASSELDRVFELGAHDSDEIDSSTWTGLRHSLVPRLGYYRTSHRDQWKNPFYDSTDRTGEREEIVMALDNTFTRRRESTRSRKEEDGTQSIYTSTDYLDAVRFRLSQSYDLVEDRRKNELDRYSRRPFGDVIAELDIYLDERISATNKIAWSPYLNQITTTDNGLTVRIPEWRTRLYGGLNYRSKLDEYKRTRNSDLTIIRVNGDIDLAGPFSAYFYYDWDIDGNAEQTRGLYLTYRHNCFSLSATLTKDDHDTSYGFSFRLHGFGLE